MKRTNIRVHRNGKKKPSVPQVSTETEATQSWSPVAAEMVALALDIPDPTVMVRLPKATKLPLPRLFRWRLQRLADECAYPGSFSINQPKGRQVGNHRHYVLRDDRGNPVRFLAGVAQALQRLGVMAVAEVFVADRQDGLLRRLVSLEAGEGGAAESVLVVLTWPDGTEWERIEFPEPLFARLMEAAQARGVDVMEFLEEAVREKIQIVERIAGEDGAQ